MPVISKIKAKDLIPSHEVKLRENHSVVDEVHSITDIRRGILVQLPFSRRHTLLNKYSMKGSKINYKKSCPDDIQKY